MRSEVASCCWPFCARLVDIGSGRRARSFRSRNPRFTDPSGLTVPRCSGMLSTVGDWRSDSGDPMELLATSMPDACVPCAAGTTRFRRLMTDFFMVTGR